MNRSLTNISRLGCMAALPVLLLLFATDAQAVKVLTQDGLRDGYACRHNGTTTFHLTPCESMGMEDVSNEVQSPTLNIDAPSPSAAGQNTANPVPSGEVRTADFGAPNAKDVEATPSVPAPEKLSSLQKLVRGILLVVTIFFALWVMKLTAIILQTGKSGMLSCFVAGIIAQLFAAIFLALGISLGIGKWPVLSVFATALVCMYLFQTNYLKGLVISLMSYGIFISLLSMFTMKMIGHPLLATN